MNYSEKYLDDILIRISHHSSAIEGNTISLPETVSIILENTLPSSRKNIREFYEIENHKQAFTYMFEKIDNKEEISEEIIKGLHRKLVDRLQHDAGEYKKNQNGVVGAEFQTAKAEEVPYIIRQWLDNTTYRLENSKNQKETIEVLADSHIQFERIHPFSDGNGRTGRLILMMQSIQEIGTPIIITKEKRAEYIESLAEQDIQKLANLLEESINYEKERKEQLR